MKSSFIILWILAGAVVGAVVGMFWNNIFLGIFCGMLLSWPIGLALGTHKRRWWAVASLFINYLVAWKYAGITGLLLTLGCTAITLFMSAAILRDLYGGSEWKAFIHHVRILTGLLKGFHIVSEGANVIPSGKELVLGPRKVIIRPNTAVIMESGAKHTHTLGPGSHDTKPFEYVKYIFDLRPRTLDIAMPDVRTRDHLTVRIIISVLAAIQIPRSIRTGAMNMNDPADIQYDPFRRRLEHIYDLHGDWDWHEATKSEIESQVRRYAASLDIEEITDAARYQDLADKIVLLTNKRVSRWGIRVDRAIVSRIELDQAVSEKMKDQWEHSLERQVASDNELAQAHAWASALKVIAVGYRYARKRNMPEDAINRMILMRTLERITAQPGIDIHLSAAMITDLSDLRRTLGLTP